jgi:hypothetical protein
MRIVGIAVSLVAIGFGQVSSNAQPGSQSRPHQDCFFTDDFEDWRAPDASTIYIRVRPDRYYRLELAGQCPKLRFPGSHLITNTHGKRSVCTALDWDLSVQEQNGGSPEQCVVRTMKQLSPGEISAIPMPFKP